MCRADDPQGRSNSTPIVCFSCAKSVFYTDNDFRECSMSMLQINETRYKIPYKNLANKSIKHLPKHCEGCLKQSSTYLPPYRVCVECRFTDCYKAKQNRFEFFFNLCFCGLDSRAVLRTPDSVTGVTDTYYIVIGSAQTRIMTNCTNS